MKTEWTMLVGLLSLLPVLGCGGDDKNTSGAGGSGGSGGQSGSASSNSSSGAGGSSSSSSSSGSGGAGGSIVNPPTCVDPATLPSWRQGIAVGEWKALPSADLTAVTPTVQPGGGYYGRIDAWNGFGADTVNSVLYLGAAGGHGDYAGNEVYTLD